jgi:hypothetical protein
MGYGDGRHAQAHVARHERNPSKLAQVYSDIARHVARGALSAVEVKTALRPVHVHRLGNYLLLEPKLNRGQAANGPLEDKKAAYAQSQYPSTRTFDWDTWNPRTIDERQARLARVATAVWRLP